MGKIARLGMVCLPCKDGGQPWKMLYVFFITVTVVCFCFSTLSYSRGVTLKVSIYTEYSVCRNSLFLRECDKLKSI